MLSQAHHTLAFATHGKDLIDITGPVVDWTARQSIATGLLTLWCPHTSASLTVQENADPTVRADIKRFFQALVPESGHYQHNDEGTDDMPAHLRTMLTQTSLSIPVRNTRLTLGTWQAIYLFEHRTQPRNRTIFLHLLGT